MNSKGASILVNPHPSGHIVYPYTDESLVGHAVTLFASAGLREGEGVVLIVAAGHCESIKLRLRLEGIDPEMFERSGQLTCVLAEDLLAGFVRDGVLDEGLFRSTIAALIGIARKNAPDPAGKVRIFGEMVSQLRATDLQSTTRLEELWNKVIEEHSVSLLCTYALDGEEDKVPDQLADLHSVRLERDSKIR